MTTTYDFDVSSHAFKHFYQNQTGTGGSIPVFRGLTRQRGYGIGGIFFKDVSKDCSSVEKCC